MTIRDIASADLQRLIECGQPLLVDFVTAGCPWCERLEPELERLADSWAERVAIVKLRIDDAPELVAAHQLRGAPTLVLWDGGERRGSKQGFQRTQQLDAFLRHHLGDPAGS